MAEQLIDVIGVAKYFGKDRILEDINFSVEKGKTIALVGHNGCGKSTLLRMIALLTTVSGGEIIHHKKLENHLYSGAVSKIRFYGKGICGEYGDAGRAVEGRSKRTGQ